MSSKESAGSGKNNDDTGSSKKNEKSTSSGNDTGSGKKNEKSTSPGKKNESAVSGAVTKGASGSGSATKSAGKKKTTLSGRYDPRSSADKIMGGVRIDERVGITFSEGRHGDKPFKPGYYQDLKTKNLKDKKPLLQLQKEVEARELSRQAEAAEAAEEERRRQENAAEEERKCQEEAAKAAREMELKREAQAAEDTLTLFRIAGFHRIAVEEVFED